MSLQTALQSLNRQELQPYLEQYEANHPSIDTFHQDLGVSNTFENFADISEFCKDYPLSKSIALWILGMYASLETPWTQKITHLSFFTEEISWFPSTLRHINSLRQLHIEFNPITDSLDFLLELNNLDYVAISYEQRPFLPAAYSKTIVYADIVSIGMKMDFLSRDLTVVPEAIQQAKELYQQGTDDSLRQAKELLIPFLYASLIVDDWSAVPTLAQVCDYTSGEYLCSDEYIYLEEFFFEFREENAPYIGAVASTCVYFIEESYLSENGEPRDVPIDFFDEIAMSTTIELTDEEIWRTHNDDWLSVYEGQYTAYFSNHITQDLLEGIANPLVP